MNIVEVYERFNAPCLMLIDKHGDKYLMYWCDVATSLHVGYLCMYISPEKLDKLRYREIDYRTAFKTPERGCTILYTNGDSTFDYQFTGFIEDEFYPPEGYFVEYIDNNKMVV